MSISDSIDKIVILKTKIRHLPWAEDALCRQIRDENTEEVRLIRAKPEIFELECELTQVHEQAWKENEIVYGCMDKECGPQERDEVFEAIRKAARLNRRRIFIKNEIERVLGTGFREEKSFNQEAAYG